MASRRSASISIFAVVLVALLALNYGSGIDSAQAQEATANPTSNATQAADSSTNSSGDRVEKIVFVSDQARPNGDIFIADPDGKNIVKLTTGPNGYGYPMVSPDGKHITYLEAIKGQGGLSSIWIMDPNGANAHQLTKLPGQYLIPAWSADSTRIFFTEIRDPKDKKAIPELHSLNLDGTKEQQIKLGNGTIRISLSPIAISPDGKFIAFTGTDTTSPLATLATLGFGNKLFISDIDGSNVRRLDPATTVYGNIDFQSQGYPAWSPDQSRIAYTMAAGEGLQITGYEIYIVASDGSSPKKIVTIKQFTTSIEPSWSPNGKQLIFWEIDNNTPHGAAYMMEADGSNLKRFIDDPKSKAVIQAVWASIPLDLVPTAPAATALAQTPKPSNTPKPTNTPKA